VAELIAGYRLRVVSPPHLTPPRLTGTRLRDGVRVGAVSYPLADDLAHGDLASDHLEREGVACEAGMALGGCMTDIRRALAVLQELRPAGVLVPDEAVEVDGGVALIYAEPPRHTLAELLERGSLAAAEIVGVLIGVMRPLSHLAEAGLPHPGVRADGLWLTAEGEVVLGDAGLAGASLTQLSVVGATLALAESLLCDVAPSTTAVARLGLDAADSGRRELAEEVVGLRAAYEAGLLEQALDLGARLRDYMEPESLTMPADWQRAGEDLAGLLRARAVADRPDQQSTRWPGARFRFTAPRRASGITAPASPADGGQSGPRESAAHVMPAQAPTEYAALDTDARTSSARASEALDSDAMDAAALATDGLESDGHEPSVECVDHKIVDYGPEWDDLASPSRLRIPSLRSPRPERVREGRAPSGRSVPKTQVSRRAGARRGGTGGGGRASGLLNRAPGRSGAHPARRRRSAVHPTPPAQRIVHAWQSLGNAPLRYLPMLLIALLVSTLGTVGVVKLVDGGEHAATASGVVTRSLDASASSTAPTSGPREVEARPETPGSPASASGRSESPAPRPRATQPVRDLSGPLTDPVGLVQTLSDLRARAWRELDPARVAEVDQAESAIYRADLAAIQQARRDRLRYRGVAFTVRSATARSVGKPGHERVVLDAVVDSSAFTITPETGSPTRVAASAGDRVRMVLVWSGQHWQVAEITTPDAAG